MQKYNLVDSSVLQRVFKILVGVNNIGTSFIVENSKGKFLVTAKHIFKKVGYPDKAQICVDQSGTWIPIDNQIFYHTDDKIDIAVVKTSYFDNMNFEKVNNSSKGFIFSQELFILGYPYAFDSALYAQNRGYPIPYIKKGIFSGKCGRVLFLDCDNNQGFSGGPVIYRKYEQEGFSDETSIAGIVSGYYPHEIEVMDSKKNVIGRTVENSGMTICYPIEHAMEIIELIIN